MKDFFNAIKILFAFFGTVFVLLGGGVGMAKGIEWMIYNLNTFIALSSSMIAIAIYLAIVFTVVKKVDSDAGYPPC